MDFKLLLHKTVRMVTHTAMAWKYIARNGTYKEMMNGFLLPLIAMACVVTLVGKIIGSGFESQSVYPAVIRMIDVSLTLYFSYIISVFVVSKIAPRFTVMPDVADDRTKLFVGYSMVVILVLEICLGLFPNFRIIGWIAQFYTVKIVWDGATIMLRIPEERRLGFTMAVSIIIIFLPMILHRIVSLLLLSVNLG